MKKKIAGANSVGQSAVDRQTLVENYETFLTLLTTQLKNQNPLEPLDSNQFTEQLVQYSSVEQQIKSNENLEQLINVISTQTATSLISLIGQEVVAEGATTTLQNGRATWTVDIGADASEAEIVVRNASGSIVFTDTSAVQPGKHNYVWDGRRNDGTAAPEGAYTLTITARDDNGGAVNVSTSVSGIVSSLDFTGNETMVKIGNTTVPLSAVTVVSASPP